MAKDYLITIKGGRKGGGGQQKGVVLPGKRSKYLARRIRPETVTNPLHVYDLGRLANGADAQHVYHSTLLNPATGEHTPANGVGVWGTISTWNNTLFSTDYNNFHSVYKKITSELSNYGVSIAGFDIDNGAQGLTSSTAAQVVHNVNALAAGTQNQYFLTNSVLGGKNYKVTLTPNPAAATTTYTHDKPADVFLTPMFFSVYAFADYEHTGLYDRHVVFPRVSPIPRAATIGNATWASLWAKRYNVPGLTSGERAALRTAMFGNYSPQMYESFNTTFSTYNFVLGNISNFPTAADQTSWFEIPNFRYLQPETFGANHCVAVIRKHLTPATFVFYFIWATNNWGTSQVNHLRIVEI